MGLMHRESQSPGQPSRTSGYFYTNQGVGGHWTPNHSTGGHGPLVIDTVLSVASNTVRLVG